MEEYLVEINFSQRVRRERDFLHGEYLVNLLVNVPDKTTRSCTVRFLLAKLCLSWVKLKVGAGRLIKASLTREIVPSLLPVSTSHIDLLYCKNYTYHAYMSAILIQQ